MEATDKQQEIINKSKELRREYNRQYYQKNKEKIRNNQNQYWERKASDINLSMPESLEYYSYLLEKAVKKHEALKNGTIPREHSFSLTYAKKEVNEIEKKIKTAKLLWGND